MPWWWDSSFSAFFSQYWTTFPPYKVYRNDSTGLVINWNWCSTGAWIHIIASYFVKRHNNTETEELTEFPQSGIKFILSENFPQRRHRAQEALGSPQKRSLDTSLTSPCISRHPPRRFPSFARWVWCRGGGTKVIRSADMLRGARWVGTAASMAELIRKCHFYFIFFLS